MLGAIIGDMVGSTYEIREVKYFLNYHAPSPYEERMDIMDKKTPLFQDCSIPTDDTCWTLAMIDAIINGNRDYETYLKDYGLREIAKGNDIFGRPRFGRGSLLWIEGKKKGNSYGNGAAMRISPVAYLFDDLEEIKEESYLATIPTHNHPEAIKSAEAVATTIYLLRTGHSKEEVENYIKEHYYPLNYNLEELRHNYKFTSRAKNSVPIAIYAFFQGNDFEDCIRKAISIGGDSDTIASITGAIAETIYPIPEELKQQALNRLDDNGKNLLKQVYKDEKRLKREL